MSEVPNRVFEEALSLSADERMLLVDELLASLNLPVDPEIEQAWAVEVQRRADRIDRGEAELIPIQNVFEEIRRKYQR